MTTPSGRSNSEPPCATRGVVEDSCEPLGDYAREARSGPRSRPFANLPRLVKEAFPWPVVPRCQVSAADEGVSIRWQAKRPWAKISMMDRWVAAPFRMPMNYGCESGLEWRLLVDLHVPLVHHSGQRKSFPPRAHKEGLEKQRLALGKEGSAVGPQSADGN